ncbi:MAG: hypothetical protein V1867_00445 [Candidatus Falkowbacteria bacterium]
MSKDRNHPGLMINIDGTDGSGKRTQAEKLLKIIRQCGFKAALISFPRYDKTAADGVIKYLNKKYGGINDLGPYAASIFYAHDRVDACYQEYEKFPNIKKMLEQGFIVITDRFSSANLGHQGGKIRDRNERIDFYYWLLRYEHDLLKLPRPNINLILHVDPDVSQTLVSRKKTREYTDKKHDAHEEDKNHLRSAEKAFIEMTRILPDFKLIECMRDGRIMPPDKITNLILEEALPYVKKCTANNRLISGFLFAFYMFLR